MYTGKAYSKKVALLLWAIGGCFGAHRFYLGKKESAILELEYTVLLYLVRLIGGRLMLLLTSPPLLLSLPFIPLFIVIIYDLTLIIGDRFLSYSDKVQDIALVIFSRIRQNHSDSSQNKANDEKKDIEATVDSSTNKASDEKKDVEATADSRAKDFISIEDTFEGNGTIKNKKKALREIKDVIGSGNGIVYDYCFEGDFYAQGICVKQDLKHARKLYSKDVDNVFGGQDKIKIIDDIIRNEIVSVSSKNDNMEAEYAKVIKNYREKDIDGVLSASRKCMECILLSFSCNQNENAQGDNGLLLLINNAYNCGQLSSSEAEVYHRLRKIGNKGAHYNADSTTIEDADLAYKYITEIVEGCRKKEDIPVMEQGDPLFAHENDYYSSDRRYYGKWSNCITKADLLRNVDYLKLKQKAEQGDIEAMLDIAIGFIDQRSTMNDNGLWNMPTIRIRGKEYNNVMCYDTRYYYWICKAAIKAVDYYLDFQKWRIPMKYIPTVLLEFLKFLYYCALPPHMYNYYVNGVKQTFSGNYVPVYIDQFNVGRDLYDDFDDILVASGHYGYSKFDFLRDLMLEYEGENIIHPIHFENTIGKLLVFYNAELLYLSNNPKASTFEEGAEAIRGDFALREADIGKPRNLEFIYKYAEMLEMRVLIQDLRKHMGMPISNNWPKL